MRIQEERHGGESWLLYKIGNLTAIDSNWIDSVGFAWLFKEDNKWVFKPRVTEDIALFYNAVFFLRFNFLFGLIPCGLFWTIRWAEIGPILLGKTRAYWQSGFGWKLNGRLSILFRIQGDASAAAGVTGPNTGQATGFNYGTH